jgi:deoxyribodipyrimidine photolyase-like uncharacterized protein
MPGYESRNALDHHLPLPHWFWTGDTHMRCLQQSIKQSLQTAHAHHIQRLMVIGNFALLAGLDPVELHRWYLGIYIDAFEWVELPNTLGMSQRADGGLIATKPYVSSAAYLQRMGDYCQGCAYTPSRRPARAPALSTLYWDFLRVTSMFLAATTGWHWCTDSGRNSRLSSNQRCAHMLSNCASSSTTCSNDITEAYHAISAHWLPCSHSWGLRRYRRSHGRAAGGRSTLCRGRRSEPKQQSRRRLPEPLTPSQLPPTRCVSKVPGT